MLQNNVLMTNRCVGEMLGELKAALPFTNTDHKTGKRVKRERRFKINYQIIMQASTGKVSL